MIVGVIGPVASGKSTISDALGTRLGWPVRHCGDVVRSRARALSVPVVSLAMEEHVAIDRETREFASSATAAVLDGHFLDAVLAQVDGVFLVRLQCGMPERVRRYTLRRGNTTALAQLDAELAALRVRLYGASQALPPSLELDSTSTTVSALVDSITSRVMGEA